MYNDRVLVRYFGLQPYEFMLRSMHEFTNLRNEDTDDEVWFVEHLPVFTQGNTGKDERVLIQSDIPLIQSDRGGKITYHGPGQQLMYVLLNLKRRKISIRNLIILLEETVVNTLEEYGICAYSLPESPGVYVGKKKICSIGLRIYKGCSLHGIALNINMDLTPFLHINPCGNVGMKMTQMCHWNANLTLDTVRPILIEHFFKLLEGLSNEKRSSFIKESN